MSRSLVLQLGTPDPFATEAEFASVVLTPKLARHIMALMGEAATLTQKYGQDAAVSIFDGHVRFHGGAGEYQMEEERETHGDEDPADVLPEGFSDAITAVTEGEDYIEVPAFPSDMGEVEIESVMLLVWNDRALWRGCLSHNGYFTVETGAIDRALVAEVAAETD